MRFGKFFLPALSDRQLLLLLLALAMPAFLLHLGKMAFIGDEGIRSLVALEMKLSGNYLAPTLNGAPYYNKPPLYNWVLLGSAQLLGHFGEWPARLTTLFFLACFAWSTYHFNARYLGRLAGISAAFMLLTSGRILFWDSMLGLIDIAFSWLVYLNLMWWYHWGRAQRWRQLFLLSYPLMALAFLLKGLPAVVFQGITVLVALIFWGQLRRQLLAPAHLLGVVVGILVGLLYYTAYAQFVSLEKAFAVLLDQSLQRTPTHFSWQESLLHLFTFPLEQVYHFLPWSLFLGVLFYPQFWRWLQGHEFARYHFWLLVANLPIYWVSVQVYPRYLLMFVPLFNTIGWLALQEGGWGQRFPFPRLLRFLFLVLTGAAFLVFAAIPGIERAHQLPWWGLTAVGGALLLAGIFTQMWRDQARLVLWLAAALLVVRIGFAAMILPFRHEEDKSTLTRMDAYRLAEKYGDLPWWIYRQSETHQVARFYTANALQQIVRQTDTLPNREGLYLVDQKMYPSFPGLVVDSLRLETGEVLALMKLP